MVKKTAPRQTGLKLAALCLGLIGALAGLEIPLAKHASTSIHDLLASVSADASLEAVMRSGRRRIRFRS